MKAKRSAKNRLNPSQIDLSVSFYDMAADCPRGFIPNLTHTATLVILPPVEYHPKRSVYGLL
jgi:hypothetical protein